MWLCQRACRGRLFPTFHRHLLASFRLFSPSEGGATPPPAEPTHFMVDYLRSSCGFSDAEARRMMFKYYAHLKSSEKPDGVVRLLRQDGAGDADIKRAVRSFPRMLLTDAKRTVEPKIRELQGAGFSRPEVAQLILMNPRNIYVRDVVARVEFWRKLLGTNQDILKTMKKDPRILCYNLDNRVVLGLSLLRSLGVPDAKMGSLMRMRPRLVSGNPDKVRALVERVKSLGIPPGRGMFVDALCSVSNVTRCTLDAKFKLLRSFGWTQAELDFAVRRFPAILRYSQMKIQATMDFLLNEVGCDPSYTARNPLLVGFSLEKRLKPRFCILQSLKAEGYLRAGSNDFLSAMKIKDDTFVQKYIIPYRGKLPKLLEANHDVCIEGC